MEKRNRETKVTVRFTEPEMERIKIMLQERGELSLSEFIREKLLILNRSLELKKIRLELTEINARLGQIEMYLSRKGTAAGESFTSEILGDIQKQIRSLMLKMEEENGGYSSEEH